MGGGEILKKGFLIKSPPLEGGGMKTWRKRWFCLRSSKVLEYYKQENGSLKGVVNLEDCKAVNSDLFHKRYKYVFNVETKERVYYLVAASAEEMREWVEAICKVCKFITAHVPLEGVSGATTLPSRMWQPPPSGVAFTEKFQPVDSGAGGDIYSLAQAAEAEVYQKFNLEQRVPSGIPLSEALASKGMGSGSSRTSSLTSGGDTRSSRSSEYSGETGYFSPHPPFPNSGYLGAVSVDPHAAYATCPRNTPLNGQGPVSSSQARPKARAHTALSPTHPGTAYSGFDQRRSSSGASAPSVPATAELMSNGYMKPRPTPDRIAHYDYPPLGPPRPAVTPSNTSPKQHRSALLKHANDSGVPSSPSSSSSSDSPPQDSHTYMNMQALSDILPPPVDRTNKPLSQPSVPPRIDRRLKPRSETGTSPHASPQDPAPGFTVGSYSEDVFTESDLPLPTQRSLHYTQVEFDPVTRCPVPMPRTQVRKRRVNYSDIDLNATGDRAAKLEEMRAERRGVVSLGETEMEAFAENRSENMGNADTVDVDEDTNPEYYTYMRNFTYDEADKPEYLQFFREQQQDDSEER